MFNEIKNWALNAHNRKGLLAVAALIVLFFIFSAETTEGKLYRFAYLAAAAGIAALCYFFIKW